MISSTAVHRLAKVQGVVSAAVACWFGLASPVLAAEVLPRPRVPFAGTIGRSSLDSRPSWTKPVTAPAGAPNVVLILLDDVGFGATSAFGGAARTPRLEKLANEGVRYNRFHTTAICSPTRAALLTGRNHHQVGFGNLQDFPAGYPGYDTIWKKETASVAEVLRQNGYSTAAFGKWHNTPRWEVTPAGPFDRWPTGLGFEYFYGFHGGSANQWEPALYRNTLRVEAPAKPAQGYHLTTDLVDEATRWLHEHQASAPGRPYFLYFATGATHTPHHVPSAWIAESKGRYDQGWDALREEIFARQKRLGVIPAAAELTPRPSGLPAWSTLSSEQKRLYAHQMEVYSAFLEQTDFEVGRLVDEVRRSPGGDNTLILYVVGDNGGSAEGGQDGTSVHERSIAAGARESVASQLQHIDDLGGPGYNNHYPAAWAWATTTPFQWMKQVASHLGGTRNPLVVSWPGHVKASDQVRSQFGHVNDIAPTIYEAAGITPPDLVNGVAQVPLEGKSLLASFADPKAPEAHHTQYFDIFGNRAIYQDGWVAAAKRDYEPWNAFRQADRILKPNLEQDRWELYDLRSDYSEAHDLAATHPEKLAALKAEFDEEARRNGVYPLVPLPFGAPELIGKRRSFTYAGDVGALPEAVVPELTGRSHRIEVDLLAPARNAGGVLVAEGGRFGGFSLYVKDGRLVYENNAFGQDHQKIVASQPLPPGRLTVAYEFIVEAPAPSAALSVFAKVKAGVGHLYVGDRLVGEARFEVFAAFHYGESFDIGLDRGSAVSKDYQGPFAFNGKVEEVRLSLP
jgi:arylsulfatase